MLYALIGGVLHHALHLADAMLLISTARTEAINNLSGSRIMIFTTGKSADNIILKLQKSGAFVKVISSYNDVSMLVKSWHPELLIITDWSEGMSTWLSEWAALPFCTELPILVIGAGGEGNALSALDAGANAYLAEPFRDTILQAQVGALLKNGHSWETTEIKQEPYIWINPNSSRIWINGLELRLSRRLFRFLHYLALHPDRTFTPVEISKVLSEGRKLIQENSVAAQVHRLRKCLDAAGAGAWLETVHGFGYRLTIPQKNAFDVNLS